MGQLSTVTPAAAQPVTVADLAAHLRLGAVDAAMTAELTGYLNAGLAYVEAQTGRGLARATYREQFSRDEVASVMQLLRGPSVSVSAIRYWPLDGAQVTVASGDLATYAVALDGFLPGELLVKDALLDLDLEDRPDALTIDYVAGHTDADRPAALRQTVILVAALWFEERNPVAFSSPSELPFGLHHLIQHHRVAGWCA